MNAQYAGEWKKRLRALKEAFQHKENVLEAKYKERETTVCPTTFIHLLSISYFDGRRNKTFYASQFCLCLFPWGSLSEIVVTEDAFRIRYSF